MRGHEALLRMRLAGHRPRSVWLSMFPLQEWVLGWATRRETMADAEIQIEESDHINRLDLRCLVGLGPVYVNGPCTEATKRLADAAIQAGATRVLASYFDASNPNNICLVKMTETTPEGIKQWQA